jgi:GntR family transcriptional regulator/MocR family aminotransferase
MAQRSQQSVLAIRSNPVAALRTDSTIAGELLVTLRRDDKVALHRQLELALRDGIRAGRLLPGSALPATRTLAADLAVSRGVVVEAYAQLVAEGYLTSRSGGYTHVALAVTDPARPVRGAAAGGDSATPPVAVPTAAPKVDVDFGYGRANVSAFPRAAWLRSVRRVFANTPDARLTYLDGNGVPELRAALAAYLNRVRGTSAAPENVVITNGYAQGIALLLELLAAAGAARLAVEDPSANDDARPIAAKLGLELVAVPVGPQGVRVDALDDLRADALILTPSHQWPTGAVLSPDARSALLGWAQRTGALLIEDDYDAEYRYDHAPIGAIQGLAPDRVVYAGSASKTLAPGFRLGWLVLPADLVQPFAEAKLLADRGSPVVDQLTFADFLSRGEFDRHLRRMRPIYRARRDTLVAALRERLPELRPVGIAAGLHLIAYLPPHLDEASVVAAARARGVSVAGVSPYRIEPGDAALIFGYSDLSENAIRRGVDHLADAIAEIRAVPPAPPGRRATGRRRPR